MSPKPKTKTATCERCGKQLQVAPSRRKDSKPFRLAKVPKGVCADCVMTQFLYNTYPINMQIDEAGPELLLKPGIREAFLACGLLEHCDLTIDEIDWQRVVNNWRLPVQISKDGRNPYRMGESPRAEARMAGLPPPAYWPAPAPTDTLAKIGKEQYCPKCKQPAGPSHHGMFEDYMTDCQHCGFKSRGAVWIREAPKKARGGASV